MIERTNSTHNVRMDDELAKETQGLVQGDRPTRSDSFLDAEPPADDDPAVEGWDPETTYPVFEQPWESRQAQKPETD